MQPRAVVMRAGQHCWSPRSQGPEGTGTAVSLRTLDLNAHEGGSGPREDNQDPIVIITHLFLPDSCEFVF